jgi:signal-transduction protein with cAMP-binding, CBS, and nucleotidyltransferase domain
MTWPTLEWDPIDAMLDLPAPVVTERSPVGALIFRPAVRVAATTTLTDAAALMEARGVSVLVIEDASAVLTERDITSAVARDAARDATVDQLTRTQPVVVPGATPIVEACALMLTEHVDHLVVEMGTDGPGVVSLAEMAAALLQRVSPRLWLTSVRASLDEPTEVWLG